MARLSLRSTRLLALLLGTALVAKILDSLPDVAEILLVVRSKPGRGRRLTAR